MPKPGVDGLQRLPEETQQVIAVPRRARRGDRAPAPRRRRPGLAADLTTQIAGVNARIDRIETRLDGLDERLRNVELAFGKVDQRLLTIERVVLPASEQPGG